MLDAFPALRTVLFDLDGTLVDTAPDIAAALNRVLVEQGKPALPYHHIRPVVSHGSTALIELAFGMTPADPTFVQLRDRFLDFYRDNLAVESALFPGMSDVLENIERQGLHWGVVTNKPAWLTEPLLDQLNLSSRTACVISGDTIPQRKPHPAPMLLACEQAGCEPEHCIYIGDAQRDVEAGKNAGMRTLVALFGYLSAEDKPESWGADGLLTDPLAILAWLEQHA